MLMSAPTLRTAVGMAALYGLAAVSGALILVTQVVDGRGGFGVLAGAAILAVFGALAVRYARTAMELRHAVRSEG